MHPATESVPRAALVALLAAEEAERQHIAHELHSEIGQDLTAALLGLQFFAEGGVPAEEVPELSGSVRRALERVRALSLRLRPPLLDEIGLGPALESSLGQIAASGALDLELDLPAAGTQLSALSAILLFRALQALARQLPSGHWRLRLRLEPAAAIELTGALTPALTTAFAESLLQRLCLLQARLDDKDGVLRIAFDPKP